MLKKIIALIIAYAIFSSNITLINAAWYDASLQFVTENGYMQGDENGDFSPERNITRAEFCTVINRVTGVYIAGEKEFKDVKADAWYRNAVQVSANSGYVNGDSDGSFRPEDFITRQESAVILNRIFCGDNETAATFRDLSSVPDWAKASVCAVANQGIMNGFEDGSFGGEKYITRAEVATVLMNILNNVTESYENIEDAQYEGNLIITKNTKVINTTVTGNVYITDAVARDGIVFESCTVGGNIVYCGGEGANIKLENTSAKTFITCGINEIEAVLSGDTKLDLIILKTKTNLRAIDYTGGNIPEIKVYVKSNVGVEADKLTSLDGVEVNSEPEAETENKNKNESYSGKPGNAGNVSAGGGSSSGGSSGGGGSSSGGSSGGGGSSSGGSASHTLTSLTVSDSKYCELSPKFSANVKEYTLDIAPGMDSVGIMLTYPGSCDCMQGENVVSSGGEYVLSGITSGENTFTFDLYYGLKVVASYTIKVVRPAEVTSEMLASFNESVGSLTVADFENLNIYNVNMICVDEYNSALTALKAENGADLTYSQIQETVAEVNAKSAYLNKLEVKNDEQYLQNLNLIKSDVTKDTFEYEVLVDEHIESVDIYTDAVTGSTVTVNSTSSDSQSSYRLNLIHGVNACIIKVKSEDGTSENTYTVTVTRNSKDGNHIKNMYFNDGLSGYTLTDVQYAVNNGIYTFTNSSSDNSIVYDEFVSLQKDEKITVSLDGIVVGARPRFALSLIGEDGSVYDIGSGRPTVGESNHEYEFTAGSAGRYQLCLKLNGTLGIKAIALYKQDTSITNKRVYLSEEYELVSSPYSGSNDYILKLKEPAGTSVLNVEAECAQIYINSEACTSKEIELPDFETKADIRFVAEAGNFEEYSVYIVRDYLSELDGCDEAVLAQINDSARDITYETLLAVGAKNAEEEYLYKYTDALEYYTEIEALTAERVVEIIENINKISGGRQEADLLLGEGVNEIEDASGKHTPLLNRNLTLSGIYSPKSGAYLMKVRYYPAGAEAESFTVDVNGMESYERKSVMAEETGWKIAEYSFYLDKGENDITIAANNSMYVDYLEITAPPSINLIAEEAGIYPVSITYTAPAADVGTDSIILSNREKSYKINYPALDGAEHSYTIDIELREGENEFVVTSATADVLGAEIDLSETRRFEGEEINPSTLYNKNGTVAAKGIANSELGLSQYHVFTYRAPRDGAYTVSIRLATAWGRMMSAFANIPEGSQLVHAPTDEQVLALGGVRVGNTSNENTFGIRTFTIALEEGENTIYLECWNYANVDYIEFTPAD